MNNCNIFENFLNEKEIDFLNETCKNFFWEYGAQSNNKANEAQFLIKRLINSPLTEFFNKKLFLLFKKNIKILRLYANGQSFGQCGFWHNDLQEDDFPVENKFTLVFYYQKWLPEYGGHLILNIDNKITSILPEYNKAVIFNSCISHMAFSPSRYCMSQRESIACKFFVE